MPQRLWPSTKEDDMAHTEIKVYGTLWCSDCKRTKKFFGEQRVHYEFIDIDGDAAGLATVERVNNGKHIIPTLVFGDGSTLVEPSNAELAKKLGLQTMARNRFYDLMVVGSGPAGHFCATCDGAFYRGKEVLVIGGGNSAGEESIFLTKFASMVTIITRNDRLTASKVVVEKVDEHPQIDVIANATPAEFRGNG